jgi:hypothetical protein
VVEQMMLTFDSGGHAGGISARDIYIWKPAWVLARRGPGSTSTLIDAGPEKAGVGGSIPSLATIYNQ